MQGLQVHLFQIRLCGSLPAKCPVADERKEDLKLLESAAGGEDGKPAKMLVPKAIDADDADDSDSDDESDDDESVRAGCALTEFQQNVFHQHTLHVETSLLGHSRAVHAFAHRRLTGICLRLQERASWQALLQLTRALLRCSTPSAHEHAGRRGAAVGGAGAHQAGSLQFTNQKQSL